MNENIAMSKTNNMTTPKKQRALVLGGGGSLGAYEVGVLQVLRKKLEEEVKEVSKKSGENGLLFDIIAGTSIGAMNGAILVSQFLQSGNWEEAIESLKSFWIDKKNGQASTPPQVEIEKVPGWTNWQDASNKNAAGVASKDAAWRYYFAKYFITNGVPNMYIAPYEQRLDFKFFDNDDPFVLKWFIHSAKPLQDSIEHFAHFPIAALLQDHQDYWKNARNKSDDKIPDLEVYIVNLHPSKQMNVPSDRDGVKDRHNDLTYFDRNSHYDENVANMITDYKDLINQLTCIAREHLLNKQELAKFEKDLTFLNTKKGKSKKITGIHRTYKDLIEDRFELLKVVRIEHTNYVDSVFGKTNDLTELTLSKLIKEGKCDAWVSLIKEDINNFELSNNSDTTGSIDKIKNSLFNILDQIANSLKENNFEDNKAAYDMFANFMDEIGENKKFINDPSKVRQMKKIEKCVESFKKDLESG
jgi:hypothetical protein